MEPLNFEALKNNMIYILKESQMKLGYTDNAASLNYPPLSLCRILGRELSDSGLMQALYDFSRYAAPELGALSYTEYDGQICITVPAQGVRHVHENVPESPFLRELIDAVSAHRLRTIDDVKAIFDRYSDAVECRAVEGDGYDHVIRFSDGQPDDFVYLFETDFGHVSYHRMLKADYEADILS